MSKDIIDNQKHIDYRTDETAHGLMNARVVKIMKPAEVLKEAVHENRLTNRQIGKKTFRIVQQYVAPLSSGNDDYRRRIHYLFKGDDRTNEFGDSTDFDTLPVGECVMNYHGMAKIARKVLPKGIFDWVMKGLDSNDIADVLKGYDQGYPASDPMYTFSTDPFSSCQEPIDNRMWLYPPKQAKKLKPKDRFLNKIRVSVYRAILPILLHFNNNCYNHDNWNHLSDECHRKDADFPEYMASYGVLIEEHRYLEDGKAWHVNAHLITTTDKLRYYKKVVRYQKQFRNGTIEILNHDQASAYIKKHIKPQEVYGVNVNNCFDKALEDPKLTTFKNSIALDYRDDLLPHITAKADMNRYLKYVKQTAKE